jgi:hypothetical protein
MSNIKTHAPPKTISFNIGKDDPIKINQVERLQTTTNGILTIVFHDDYNAEHFLKELKENLIPYKQLLKNQIITIQKNKVIKSLVIL